MAGAGGGCWQCRRKAQSIFAQLVPSQQTAVSNSSDMLRRASLDISCATEAMVCAHGHKAAFASLQPLFGAQAQPAALLWDGRALSIGRSGAAVLHTPAPLASRCHALLQAASDATPAAGWISDTSTHGTLLLELPPSAPPPTSLSELAALDWAGGAHLLSQASQRLASRHLVVIGISPDWHAAAAAGHVADELQRSVVLLFELLCSGVEARAGASCAAGKNEAEPMLAAPPPLVDHRLANLPFARTPSRQPGAVAPETGALPLQHLNTRDERHRRIQKQHPGRIKHSRKDLPLYQAFRWVLVKHAGETQKI